VAAFLAGAITFPKITQLVSEALTEIETAPINDLSDVLRADRAARSFVEGAIGDANKAPARQVAKAAYR
jgi:1-deoxy-D-xylulose 5-phosphate reductoisomerase